MGIRKHVPNAITCCNLLCGCIAVIVCREPSASLAFILLAAFFDFFDGLAARSLKAYSPIGKDLDSLADMVSFGVAPALVGFRYVQELPVKAFGCLNVTLFLVALALPLFIAVFSALRLAKFNNDKRQTENFIGLATPACAILYVSLMASGNTLWHWCYWVPVAVAPVLCWLLVSEIPMFSMKFKNLSWADNRTRYIFLMIVAVEVVMAVIGGYSFPALLAAVITTYIIVNILMLAFRKRA